VSYRVIVKPSAERAVERLPLAVATRVVAALTALAEDPRPHGCTKMQGAPNLWRIRTGDYRIVYEIDDRAIVIVVLRVAHRKDVYR
jgi:mRNA interferase RelE/StbE